MAKKTRNANYRAIPDSKPDLMSLHRAVEALRANVETLTGQNPNVESVDERINRVVARSENSFSQYYSNVQVVAKKNFALSERIDEVNATVNDGFANGRIKFKATAAPSGYTAEYDLVLTAQGSGDDQGPEVKTGFSLLAQVVGGVRESSIKFRASQFKLVDPNDDSPKPVFNYTGGVFRFNVPVRVVTGDLANNAATFIASNTAVYNSSGDFATTGAIDHVAGASYWVFGEFDGAPGANYTSPGAIPTAALPKLHITAYNIDTAVSVTVKTKSVQYVAQSLSGGGFTYNFLYTGNSYVFTPPNGWVNFAFRVTLLNDGSTFGISMPLTITAMTSKR